MKNLNKKKICVSILIILIIFSAVFLFSHATPKLKTTPVLENQNSNLNPTTNIPASQTKQVETVLEINGVSYEDTITQKMSVYGFMSQLRNEGKINFEEQNYIGMGKFIDKINGVKNSSSLVWIYYVNGVEAQVGVSNYKINPGDVISWKYEKSDY